MVHFSKLFLLLSLLLYNYEGISQTNDSIEIVKTFDLYKKATQEKNGAEVYHLLDKNTREWYAQILDKIKYADSVEITNLSLNDKLMVLTSRLIIDKDSIFQFDARTFCIYITNKTAIGANNGSSIKLKTVSVNDQKAKAPVLATPEGDIIEFEFNKENGVWKFNLSSVFEATDLILKKHLSDYYVSDNEYALHALETISEKTPTNGIWKPLFVKPSEQKNR